MNTCLNCQSKFESKDKRTKFCSHSCSAKFGNLGRIQTQSTRDKISFTLRNRNNYREFNPSTKKYLVNPTFKTCPICKTEFLIKYNKDQKYCSKRCAEKSGGGYREGSGRSKTGYFKGIYCGSTYELAWIVYRIDHDLPVQRFQGFLQCKITGKKYFPDFIIDNHIIEIKGYDFNQSVAIKSAIATSYGYDITVLYKKDLAVEFKHLKENYKFQQMSDLYDNSKHSYTEICSFCKIGFTCTKSRINKSGLKYCSRKCAGKSLSNKKNGKLINH